MYTIAIARTRTGHPAFWVGGGAYTNTFTGRFVLTLDGLPRAFFIKSRGPLACEKEQALVLIEVGDWVIEVDGPMPINLDNPDLRWRAEKILSIHEHGADVEVIDLDLEEIPAVVLRGLSTYHNRDGSYFTA